MESQTPCAVCNGHGHRATKCPSLCDPLKEGFYSGGGQGGGHSHDDDDDERLSRQLSMCSLQKARNRFRIAFDNLKTLIPV